ncbi:MAG: flavodoxin [Campylobacteraceae bacterium]|jgi:flavodoxin I|nr:flavodoxin [Campylobacteraceae bacterium]
MSIAIVYGSSGGNTEGVAKLIQKKLGKEADLIDISKADASKINSYDKLILGTSTWYEGELQDDWDSFDKEALEFSGKTVALFGLGDQEGYGGEFCNGVGALYELSLKKGANVVGDKNSTDGYNFEESKAVVDGKFVGLIVDEDNQSDLTASRVEQWVESIKSVF